MSDGLVKAVPEAATGPKLRKSPGVPAADAIDYQLRAHSDT